MSLTSNSFRIVLQRNRKKYVRIDVLNFAEAIVERFETEAIDGSITINANNQSRRMCSLVLKYSARLIPSPDSPIWLNKKMRVWTGIFDNVNETVEYYNHGIFYMSRVNIDTTNGSESISIEGLDKTVFLNGTISGQLKSRNVIPANTPIHQAIRSTASTLGNETKLLIDTSTFNTPFEIERARGDTVWSLLDELTRLYMNWQIYYDVNGFLNFNQRPSRLNDPVLWDFTDTDTTLNASGVRNFDHIRNSFLVYGKVNMTTGVQAQATAQITNASDPNSPFTIERLGGLPDGERVLVITDDNYFTNEQCLQRLNFEKFQRTNFNERISFSTVPIDFLDVNQIINYKLQDDEVSKYVIDSINFGLRYDAVMNIEAYKLT